MPVPMTWDGRVGAPGYGAWSALTAGLGALGAALMIRAALIAPRNRASPPHPPARTP